MWSRRGRPGRDPLVGDLVLQLGGAAIGELHAFGRERDRELVARKARAAVLHHPQIAEGRPVDHLMPEHDHAIDHELQEAVAVVVVVSPTFCVMMPVSPVLRQPVADAIDLAPLRDRVVEQAEQHVDPVEDDALGIQSPSPWPRAGRACRPGRIRRP